MAEWRKQIAEFNHPQGASIVVVNANGDCDTESLMRNIHAFIDPKITILVVGSLKILAHFISKHAGMYKHAWHICTTNYYPKKK